MSKKLKFKLKHTLYDNDGYLDKDKEEGGIRYARKGEVFKLEKITEKMRQEEDIAHGYFHYILTSKTGKAILLEELPDKESYDLIGS